MTACDRPLLKSCVLKHDFLKHKQINLILRSRADVLMSLLTSHLMQESGRRNWKSQKTISQKKAKAKLAKKKPNT